VAESALGALVRKMRLRRLDRLRPTSASGPDEFSVGDRLETERDAIRTVAEIDDDYRPSHTRNLGGE
jgi:hypothetical protein